MARGPATIRIRRMERTIACRGRRRIYAQVTQCRNVVSLYLRRPKTMLNDNLNGGSVRLEGPGWLRIRWREEESEQPG
jgi:hypothetical protein